MPNLPIGKIVAQFGFSAEFWRKAAAAKKVRAVRPSGPGGDRYFDVDSCADYVARLHAEAENPTPAALKPAHSHREIARKIHREFMAKVQNQ